MGVAQRHGSQVDVEWSEGSRHYSHAILRSQPLDTLCPGGGMWSLAICLRWQVRQLEMQVHHGIHVLAIHTKAVKLPKEFKFGTCIGRELQVWFLGVLHREFICQDKRYNHARLNTPEEDDNYFTILDIPIKSNFAVLLNDGSRDFGLDIMTEMRPLKGYSFNRRKNLADEDSDVQDWWLVSEKEEKNSQQAKLK